MNSHKAFKAFLLLTVLAFGTTLLWVCRADKVGPKAPLDIGISTIVADLATAESQDEAVAAITNLIKKTGVGTDVRGSRYAAYILDDHIQQLAQAQLQFLNGQYDSSVGDLFADLKEAENEDWQLQVNLDEALQQLRDRATAALRDPEQPNRALLLVITAEGPQIPESISVYDASSVLSPVQEVLLTIWLDNEFGKVTLEKTMDSANLKFCFLQCRWQYLACRFDCRTLQPPERFTCIRNCESEFKVRLHDCILHDQGDN